MSLETIDFKILGLQPGDRVLDLGCGEGRHAISAYLQFEIDVVGLDLNRTDLQTARQRLQAFERPPQAQSSCHFINGSGLTLPFPDNSFDKVICAEVLEHVPDYQGVLREIHRVLKPQGLFAASVPRYFPEWVCWQLSDAYHEVEGGHIRIFRSAQLRRTIEAMPMRFIQRHWAHSLHVPYWWLRCMFWSNADNNSLVKAYHRLLVWDLMKKPRITRLLDRLLNPLMGKSVVLYFENQA